MNILEKLWQTYIKLNPQVSDIYNTLLSQNHIVHHDHIGLRTIDDPRVDINTLAKPFLEIGYQEKQTYYFKEKKLIGKQFESADPSRPIVFISELILAACSEHIKSVFTECIDNIPTSVLSSDELVISGNSWDPICHEAYQKLLTESEYAAWFYVFGFTANHFAIDVNKLAPLDSIEKVNHYLTSLDYKLNLFGGAVKGSKEQRLEQSSTMAGKIDVPFKQGKYAIPSTYYEFAKRYKGSDGVIFNGFINESANRIYESTDVKPDIRISTNQSSEKPFILDTLAKFSLANTIYATWRIGFWETFITDPETSLEIEPLIESQTLNKRITLGLIEHLMSHDFICRINENGVTKYRLSEHGKSLINDNWIAYVVFYMGGYKDVVHNSDELALANKQYGSDVIRDFKYVALGTEMMSQTKHHKSYETVYKRACHLKPKRILDIGCGNAVFLNSLFDKTNATFGVGVDMASEAIALAEDYTKNLGDNRPIKLITSDMNNTQYILEQSEEKFDLVTAMMVLHESLIHGHDYTVQLLKNLSGLLNSEHGRLLILDKHTDALDEGQAIPYFTEYKLIHDLTYQDLCSKENWEEIIDKAGLKINYCEKLPRNTGSILLECSLA